jgi:hypothetical protein
MINKNKLVFDPADADNSDFVGSYVLASDGTKITHTTVSGKEGLDVNVINASLDVTATDLDIRDLSHAQDSVKIGDGSDFLAINADGSINITDNGGSLTIDAIDLDIRDLAFATDKVDVSGSSVSISGDVNVTQGTSPWVIGDGGGSITVDGSVSISSMSGQYAEDSVHASGDIGNFMLAVRNDTNAVLTSNDGDYSPIAVSSSGAVRTTVNFSAVNGGTLPGQQAIIGGYDGANVRAIKVDSAGELQVDVLSLPGSLQGYADGSVWSAGSFGAELLAVRKDAAGPLTGVADGDMSPLQVNANGELKVSAAVDFAGDYAEDSAHSSGDIGLYMLSVRQDTLSASTSADGDYQSFKTDALGRLYANNSHQSMAYGAVSVTTSATDLVASDLANRKRILIQNLGSKKVYLGDASVTVGSGIELFSGASMELDVGPGINLHAIAASGTQDIRVMELA